MILKFMAENFNEIGKGGLWYLYQSLGTFHDYATKLNEAFQDEAFLNSLAVKEMAKDMKLDQEVKEKLNIFAILAGAVGMASFGVAANPLAAGAMTFLGGFMGMMGEVNQPYALLHLP
jgi:hypothetical protein